MDIRPRITSRKTTKTVAKRTARPRANRIRRLVNHLKIKRSTIEKLNPLRDEEARAKTAVGLMLATLLISFAHDATRLWLKEKAYYSLSHGAERILDEPIGFYSNYLELDGERRQYKYNDSYEAPTNGIDTLVGSPKFSAAFSLNPEDGYSVFDSVNNVAINLKPLFNLREPHKKENRLIYPLLDQRGAKVVTLGGSQIKEDIILESYTANELSFRYEVVLPNSVELRIENDGSLGIYGVNQLLLGNASTGTPEDEELLEKARENGDKNVLLFSSPAPFVLEDNTKVSSASAWYTYENGILTTHVADLDQAEFPLSVDPSIYIETARKLMRGNNETNIDFDVDNELIQKGFTTGARFDTWNNTMNLNDGRTDHGTAVAGGFIYTVGGEKGGTTITSYTTAGSDTFVVPSGVTEVTIKAWGAGGGGAGGGSNGGAVGGSGGGGGYVSSTLSVTELETLDVYVGEGGGEGDYSTGTSGDPTNYSGDGGGGGGRSYIERSGTPLAIAGGGGGGGGGDNSSGTDGGGGGAGGGSAGTNGSASSSAPGGYAGGTSCAGTLCDGGNGSENDGDTGGSEFGGDGADGATDNSGTDGSKANGGLPNGGPGGNGDEDDPGFGAGGGGGDGYFGGGGGSSSIASNAGAGGGGGGSGYITGTSTTNTAGSGTVPGNAGDSDRGGAGDGGAGGPSASSGTAGDDGKVIISYTSSGSGPRADVYWAQLSTTNNSIESPNPGAGVCTEWCTDSSYDLPDERVGMSLIAYNGFLYAIGGEDDTGTRQNTVYIAKLGANGEPSLWHPTDTNKANWDYWYASSNTLSTATSYGAAAVYNNRIYYGGGSTSGATGGVTTMSYTELSPTGDIGTWSTSGMAALPSARHMHTLHVYNDYIYLVGGNSSGTLQNSVYFNKLDSDGTMNTWTATESFATARSTWGGNYSVVWGGYLYIMGGCTAVNGSGYCTTIASDIQLASINADGSIGPFAVNNEETNQRIGFGLLAWDDALYRIGGCDNQNGTNGDCDSVISDEDYTVINPDGDASTVSDSEPSGSGDCVTPNFTNCDLPPAGDSAGQAGQMASGIVINNGYIYVVGGCTDISTSTECYNGGSAMSGNVAYSALNSVGQMVAPDTCPGTTYGHWCVDSTNRINGTTGVGTMSMVAFNNTLYSIGGTTGDNWLDDIFYVGVNPDGSLSGAWSSTTFATLGLTGTADDERGYMYSFARANPSSAGTNPGNLYILGGCRGTGSTSNGVGCNTYYTDVIKCNIGTTGAPNTCTTSGQLQIDADDQNTGSQGIGLMAGTIYANRIYLVGGACTEPGGAAADDPCGSNYSGNRRDTIYARIDDSNNIVAESGGAWQFTTGQMDPVRRRAVSFGYNGHVYSLAGYSGTASLQDLLFAKIDVSTGDMSDFSTSGVVVTPRWDLRAIVSNGYVYAIGGCGTGTAPVGCTDMQEEVQTFQLYNNDSGAPVSYGAGANLFSTDRFAASSVIYNGHIYLAGGCTSTDDCSAATADVQYAALDAEGDIGTWASTSADLPAARAWGQLEEAGGSLYWIGGQDSAGDEKSEVYYTTPEVSSTAEDVFRTTQYKINSTEFSGSTYTLTLNNDLEENYYAMVAGAADIASNQGNDEASVRVDGDPFGHLGTTTNDNEILLSRGSSSNNWVGSVTVVECLVACGTDGFRLKEVFDTSLAAGSTSTLQTTNLDLAEDHTDNTVPFGGYYGGGLESTSTANNAFSTTAGVHLYKDGSVSDRVVVERLGTSAVAPAAADLTTYIVEWGSNWTVTELNVSNWNAGGTGADQTSEYSTTSIGSTVTRAETWLWKSPGLSEDDGLGDGVFGKILTLGDGVNENATETTIALGSYQSSTEDIRDDTVYVMEHADLASDYRFKSNAGGETSLSQTVDAYVGSEAYSTSGNITTSEGYRIPLYYHADSGTGTAYARVAGWSLWYTASTTLSAAKTFQGNQQAGWFQSIDFAGIDYTPTNGDLGLWQTASNGLPADRTQMGAASWNDRLYVVGGLNDSATETNSVYYSPSLASGGDISSAWTSDADVPDVARSGTAVITYANNLYIYGGYDGTNYLNDSQFTQINSDGSIDAWTFSTPLPEPIRYADGYAVNGYTYLVGGETNDQACESNTWVAPISANTTIVSGNDPTGIGEWYETNVQYSGDRYGATVSYDQGKVYVLGGGCLSSNETVFDTAGSDTYSVPAGVTSITAKIWGAGGGGGAGGQSGGGVGGAGGGGGFVQSTLTVTALETLNIYVGGAGGAGSYPGTSGGGGGGGGHSEIDRSGTRLLIAAGGGGGGGGDNSSTTSGGAGGAGGGTTGVAGSASSNANGGTGGSQASGGTGGTGGIVSGTAGGLESAGDGGNGSSGTGGENNGGAADDGDGGTAATNGYAGGAGGGGGYYGGGGGSASQAGNAGGGGGGGGSNYLSGISQTDTQGSGSTPGNSSDGDRAGAGNGGGGGGIASAGSAGSDGIVVISYGSPTVTLTGANRVVQTAVHSQPQVAKYSRLIDTDTDVFPNKFLLNGVDNSIGARWEVDYFSSTSATAAWGQVTEFGEVTLGTVNDYTPVDGTGTDTNFARFMFFWIEIDASRTFGYPEDVARGPTITDLTLFFTSDPGKRLRHGKTFTGGEKQPLDTPPP